MPAHRKPTAAQLERARESLLADVWEPDARVVFCGINPSLYSAAVGHHFARPGNRFWPALHRSGWTDRLLSPFEDHLLPTWGMALTNIVARATARADELSADEFRHGAATLEARCRRLRPRVVAVLGISAYRTAFDRPDAQGGQQPDPIGAAQVWVLPNPSGLNAHYRLDDLAALYRQLRLAVN